MLQQGDHPEFLHLKIGREITVLDLWPAYQIHLHLGCNWNIDFLFLFYGNAPIFPVSLLIGTAFISSGKDLIEIHLLGCSWLLVFFFPPSGSRDAAFGITRLVPRVLWDVDGKRLNRVEMGIYRNHGMCWECFANMPCIRQLPPSLSRQILALEPARAHLRSQNNPSASDVPLRDALISQTFRG